MPLTDPPPVPEGGNQLKAKDLKNKVIIIKPTEHDTVPGKDDKPWEFVAGDVWVLDRAGVTETGQGVRFSWWKAVAQLKGLLGEFVACKPTEMDDNSVELVPLAGEARDVAAKIVDRLERGETVEQDIF